MKQLSIMLKPASSLCNLRCRYCFYAEVADLRQVRSFGVMTPQTTRQILQNIRCDLSPGDRITFAFQGGEPTLAGLSYFQDFTAQVEQWEGIQVQYALQTNATLLDDAWCAFLKKYHFLVGVSWDILPQCHDEARVDASGAGTNRAVLNAIGLLNKWGVEYNVLCTLTNFIARHPNQVWNQLARQDIRFVQFTPCLDELEAPGESAYALTPARFASFYDRIFDLWYADFLRDRYRSVKLIDDLVNLLAYGMPTACGITGQCIPQLVVESDGSVYPCDFYCMDEYRMGNLAESSLREIFDSPIRASFPQRPHRQPELCASCEFAPICGGNCKRMQRQICCGPEDSVCGYRLFLQKHIQQLQRISLQQRQYRR